METEYGEVQVTCGSQEEAERIADALIGERLAACVHLSPIESVYEWDGAVEHDREIALAAKTRIALLDDVIGAVRARHSYDLPAITVVPMGGCTDYLAWIDEQTAPAAG